MLEKLFGRTLPQDVISFRGSKGHSHSSTLVTDRDLSNVSIDETVRYKVSLKNFYTPEIEKKIREYYKYDFDFCARFGFNYVL
jgi:hypothetical protein